MERVDASKKVIKLLRDRFGENSEILGPSSVNKPLMTRLEAVLAKDYGTRAADISFHLSDWGQGAAFIALLQLEHHSFTDEEILEGVESFLLHAPNHIAAAAKLSGNAVQDVFNVNALDGIHQFD